MFDWLWPWAAPTPVDDFFAARTPIALERVRDLEAGVRVCSNWYHSDSQGLVEHHVFRPTGWPHEPGMSTRVLCFPRTPGRRFLGWGCTGSGLRGVRAQADGVDLWSMAFDPPTSSASGEADVPCGGFVTLQVRCDPGTELAVEDRFAV